MRLLNRKFPALAASLGLTLALSGCGGGDGLASAPGPESAGVAATGPAADYPITIGDAYNVAGTSYTPADIWNYDEVGSLALDRAGGNAISGSHHTLPVPSYVEVTSLDTGRTILVRLERRGPMNTNDLIALSPGAMAQLGASPTTPVRVRRVNPQEPERAALRAGQSAPLRMDTPMSLVNVLRLKLPGGGGSAAPAPISTVAVAPSSAGGSPAAAAPALPPLDGSAAPVRTAAAPPKQVAPRVAPAPAPKATPAPAPKVPATVAQGKFVVQAGAFSNKERAEQVARKIGGSVSASGKLFRVRVGPYASRQAAEASLAKVKAAGYSDARIY